VIVDEAHHLRNRSTLLWKLASSLKTKYMLLLTATPVQNSVEDLHSLVTVLKPGLLRTPKDFHRRFTDRADRLMPKNLPELNRLVADVMVRNRRGTTGVAFTRRTAHTQAVSFFLPEREMYAGVSRVVRQALREHTGLSRMALLTLQKELGSSTRAAAATLRKLASEPRLGHALRVELQDLASAASLISGSAKLDRLAELVSSFPGKMLIFTQFRETQSAIMERLSAEGVPAVQFHGGLSRLEKEEVVRRFQEETRVMVATDAGSEGRNLQFCNAICNFDLPWNPMRIEQRIGRLSRIGQQRDVEVFNLVATDTLEAAILHLLEAKIAMFELVVVRST
jgi:SNF2 family DNA or RNA helicase